MATTIRLASDAAMIEVPDWQAKLRNASADKVKDILRDAGRFLQAIENAGTPARKALGHVLVETRERKLHLEWGYDGWMGFMEDMPKLAFVSTRTSYEAIEMAESEAIGSLDTEKLAALPLTNARTIVKVEKAQKAAGRKLDPGVIEQAVALRPKDFRREVSAEEGATVRVWVADKAAAGEIERIVKVLAGATPQAAKAFADFLESAELVAYAGNGADSKIDAILGYLATAVPVAIKQEGDQAIREWVNGISDAAYAAQP